nr:hypothetical protein CFP56_59564 [Quercus suber]
MTEREEPLGFGDVSAAGVAVPESEATIGGAAETVAGGDDVEVRPRESLLPLQDPWYCLSSLFLAIGAPELPSMGEVNPLELGLSHVEFVIAEKLLETFGGASASWGAIVLCQGASLPLGTLCLGTLYPELDKLHNDELERPPYHIIKFSIHVVLLQTFIWEHLRDYIDVGKDVSDVKVTNWVVEATSPNTGFHCPNPFPNARPGSQEFGLNDHEKILNFLLITSPSFIPYPNGAEFGLTQYNPHRVLRQFGFDQDIPDINTTLYPLEWSEKNVIAKAPQSNPAIGAPKRSRGKSPSSEDKPKKSGECEETQLEGYDFEHMTTNFDKLLFLTSVSSHISFADVLCSIGPTDEDIEMASKSLTAIVTAEEAATGEYSVESAGKDPDVTVTAEKDAAGVPSEGRVASPTVHDAHHSKEPPELRVKSSSVAIKGMSLEEFLEKFAEEEENKKVATDFYPFQMQARCFIEEIQTSIARCSAVGYAASKLESSNLKKALEWKNDLKDLMFKKFGVQFILDKI